MEKLPREQHVVDARIQGDLIAQMTLVALVSIAVCGLTFASRNFFLPERRDWVYHLGPVLAAFVLVLPLVIYYALRVTNRIVAPVIRLWHRMRLVSEDRTQVRPMDFREGDPWIEMAHDFNVLLQLLQDDDHAVGSLDARRESRSGTATSIDAELTEAVSR